LFELQQLASQRGEDAQQGQVVIQMPLAAADADAVAAEHTHGGAVDRDQQRDKGHGF
jgi:hypothetical protein